MKLFYTKKEKKLLYIFYKKLYKYIRTLNLKPMKRKEEIKKVPSTLNVSTQTNGSTPKTIRVERDRQGTRNLGRTPKNGRYD